MVSEFTPQQILARAQSMPRATCVYDEVLSVLADNLPGVLEVVGLPAVRTWDYMGVKIESDKFPAVVVGGSIRTDAAGHHYMDSNLLAVMFVWEGPVITKEQLRAASDGAQLIRAVLQMPTVVGPRYADDGTTIIWNTLLPAANGVAPVPPNYPHFQGMQAFFDVQQYPVTGALWPTGDDE